MARARAGDNGEPFRRGGNRGGRAKLLLVVGRRREASCDSSKPTGVSATCVSEFTHCGELWRGQQGTWMDMELVPMALMLGSGSAVPVAHRGTRSDNTASLVSGCAACGAGTRGQGKLTRR